MKVAKLDQPKRAVDFHNNVSDFKCALLGAMGFSTQFITEKTGLSGSQIVYRLNKAGVKRTDYRNGKGKVARFVLRQTAETVQARLDNYYSDMRRLKTASTP